MLVIPTMIHFSQNSMMTICLCGTLSLLYPHLYVLTLAISSHTMHAVMFGVCVCVCEQNTVASRRLIALPAVLCTSPSLVVLFLRYIVVHLKIQRATFARKSVYLTVSTRNETKLWMVARERIDYLICIIIVWLVTVPIMWVWVLSIRAN